MGKIKFGQVHYLNCLPVHHALETGEVSLDADFIKGPPALLNKMFLEGQLDLTVLSSIEYARHADQCVILPDLSISSDGKVKSILLFSKVPVTELEGKTVSLTTSSATSVALLKILLEHYYHVRANFIFRKPHLQAMLAEGEAALLIGDDALEANLWVHEAREPLYVVDLGEAWKEFTGQKMVFALWVVRRDFAVKSPGLVDDLAQALIRSKNMGLSRLEKLVPAGKAQSSLSEGELLDYFRTIQYSFAEEYRQSLLLYYDYAYKSGLIKERVKLAVWGEDSWPVSVGF